MVAAGSGTPRWTASWPWSIPAAVRPLGARAHWAKEGSGCGGEAEHWVVGAADEYWPRFQRACGEMDPHRLLSVRLDEGPGVVRDHGDGLI